MSEQTKSLVGIVQEFNQLIGLLMETGGELTPEIETALAVNQEMLAAKADRYDFIVTKLESEEEYWKAQADKYVRVARACANARQRLRDSIKDAMQTMGTTEIIGENTTFKLTNGAPKLILDEKLLPREFVQETVVIEPKKDLIKAVLKEGNEVPGARFEPVVQLRTSVSRKVK